MEKKQLMTQLQSLRHKLYEIAEEKGSFTDPDVLALSEEADQLIVALQYLERDLEYHPAKSCRSIDHNIN